MKRLSLLGCENLKMNSNVLKISQNALWLDFIEIYNNISKLRGFGVLGFWGFGVLVAY